MTAPAMFIRNAVVSLLALALGAAGEGPPGAASCTGCHGGTRGGTSMPPIRDMPAEAIAASMRAFRTGERQATVMDRIARGFTEEETQAIASWFAR